MTVIIILKTLFFYDEITQDIITNTLFKIIRHNLLCSEYLELSSRLIAKECMLYFETPNERQLQFIDLKTDVDSMVAEYGDIVGLNHSGF